MRKIGLIVSLLVLANVALRSQNEVDALRYSQLTIGGTARFMGLAGAFSAVGADLSVLSTIPAGLGLYKSSEFIITPAIFNSNTQSHYYGTANSDYNNNFNLSSVGIIYSANVARQDQQGGWRNVQVGFGIVRNNNFHGSTIIGGTNPQSSLLDAYVDYANGNSTDNLNPFDTQLAYETYLIDPIPNTLDYTNRAPLNPDGSIAPVDQRKSILTEGYMNEADFSIGANYDDKLYIGATIGIPYIRYQEESHYQEINNEPPDTNTFKSFTLTETLDTRGSGFNFKFGLIYRPVDWLRFGAAVHTPSYFGNMHDDWINNMHSNLNNGNNYTWVSPQGNFDYKLETPMRAMGGIAFIFQQYGLISIDYEYVDYTKAKLRSQDYDFFSENQAITNNYTSASNIRIGTEWRIGQMNLRGGYAYYGSPYKKGINDAQKNIIAVGLGYRNQHFSLDFGYNYTFYSEDYYMYQSEHVIAPSAAIDTKNNNFLVTVGFKY